MKFRSALWTVLALTALAVPLHAQFLDTFTVSDPSNYTIFRFFPSSGSAGTFAVNGSGQFQPSSPTGTTTAYFRNTGETLSDSVFGNTVAIEIDKIASTGAAGLGFATSLTGANYFEFSLLTNTSSVTNTTNTGLTFNFTLGPVFETVTRTGDTAFAYSFTGPGLTSGPVTGIFTDANFAGQNVYFGMDVFSGGNAAASQPIEDNLSFALTAPEPSAWAMISGGVALLLIAARFRAVRVV